MRDLHHLRTEKCVQNLCTLLILSFFLFHVYFSPLLHHERSFSWQLKRTLCAYEKSPTPVSSPRSNPAVNVFEGHDLFSVIALLGCAPVAFLTRPRPLALPPRWAPGEFSANIAACLFTSSFFEYLRSTDVAPALLEREPPATIGVYR